MLSSFKLEELYNLHACFFIAVGFTRGLVASPLHFDD